MPFQLELIKDIIDHYATAGAAGGAVRSISAKERWFRTLSSAGIGAVSAYYITPILVWWLGRYAEVTNTNYSNFTLTVGLPISFMVGLTSIMLAGLIEKLADKYFKLPVNNERIDR